MIKSIIIETCPKTGEPCRHCSIEKATGSVTLLKPDIHSGMLVKKSESVNTMELGAWCNNDGRKWVDEVKVCPALLKPTKPWVPWKVKRSYRKSKPI